MFYNLSSIFLGLTAWLMGWWYVTRLHCSPLVPFGSFSCCAMSLLFQLMELEHRADLGDASAIYDTVGAIRFCAVTLISVTMLLHLLAIYRRRKQP